MNSDIDAQVAALEWPAPDPGEWDFDASHQSTPATATGQAVQTVAMRTGFGQAFARFGLPLSHMAMEFVNDWGYLSAFVHGAPRKGNGKPPPALVLKLLSRLLPSARQRTKVAAEAIADQRSLREVERYEAMRPEWISTNLELEDVDLAGLSDVELAEHVRRTGDHLRTGMTTHFDLIGQAAAVGEYLVRTEEWGIEPAMAAKAAFHGVQTSIEAGRRLDDIVTAIGAAPPVESLEQVRALGPEAADALESYLRHHGGWVMADDIDAPTLRELPHLVVESINQRRQGSGDEGPAIDAARQGCLDALGAGDQAEFERLRTNAQRAYAALDDNSGVLAAWPAGLARRAQLEAAARLVEAGALAQADDLWTLEPDEIADLLVGRGVLSPEAIAKRVERRVVNAAATPPLHLGSPPSPPPDLGVFPDPVARNTQYFFAFISAKFGEPDAPALGIGEQTVTGRAVVARSADEALAQIEPGDVMITTYTTPAYNAVMPLLGAVVTVVGGPNSHTAIVAREFGVAAVIGKADAFEAIPHGATVTVDPVAATVTVVS